MPPHLEPASTVLLTARHNGDGVFDVGAPVLGRPILPEGPPPIIATGESVDEALSDPSTHETRHDVVQLPDGRWTTRHRLGFRYLIVDAPVAPSEIDIEASVLDVARPGAFACSDEQLTRIWAAAQYTLRTCSQGLLVDGIKRDRMPWAGDQAMSTLANAFALGEGGLVADGLVALGQPGHGYVNGIADYSLWWVVNADLYVRYFDDKQFVERSADLVHSFVTDLAQYADDQGVFRPVKHPGGFADAGPGSVFIDWGVTLEQGRDSVALQMLWFWALRSAERVLRRVAHDGADRWSDLADRLETTLRTRGWTSAPGRWSDYLDSAAPSAAPYANFLAILAGLHPSPPSGVHDAARRHDAGTPFMNALRLRALIHAGSHDEVLDEIRRVWGGMLDRGPGTFWEEVTTDGDPHSMYGRPFGRSLCHAWSAGPAAIIPEAVLGVAPLADGWAEFSVDTHLGDLEWASLVIPAPAGDIVVVAEAARVSVEFPGGTTLVHADGHRVEGPAHITWRHSPADRAKTPHALSSPPSAAAFGAIQ
ncbi:alpha-L-rhamnosidase-related protein [Microbacterium sp. P5_E9]